ncbi:MAG: ABC transporter substrate-binding protein [Flexilinea sp.]
MISKNPRSRAAAGVFFMAAFLLSACQIIRPETFLTPTFTATATDIPNTLEPSVTPTSTETPLPPYLGLTPKDVDGIEIHVWHGQRDEVKKELEFLTAKFNDENKYGIKVYLSAELSDIQLNDRILENSTGGELPDMVISDSHWLRLWQTEKIPLTNLEDYIGHPIYGFDALDISPVMDLMLAQEKYNGIQIGLPLWHNPALLFYNTTWAKNLGFSNPPVTMNDFSEQICAAMDALNKDEDVDNNGTGGWILSTTTETLMSWLVNTAGVGSSLENFPQNTESDTFLEISNWLRDLFDKGCVWQSRVSEPYDYFAQRYALLYSGSFSDIQLQRRAFTDSKSTGSDDWEVIAYPRMLDNGKLREPQIYSSAVSVGIFTATAEEQFASWLFLSWLMKDENLIELALTAEGWPVQDSQEVDRAFKENANSKIYQSLNLRKYIRPLQLSADWNISSLVLADGFEHVFNASTPYDKIPDIWVQIQETLSEIINRN